MREEHVYGSYPERAAVAAVTVAPTGAILSRGYHHPAESVSGQLRGSKVFLG